MKILIKALPYKDTYIPFWELKSREDEDCGQMLIAKDDWRDYPVSNLRDVYYETNTKKIYDGIRLEYKNEDGVKRVGDKILVECGHRKIKELIIEAVEWEFSTSHLDFGNKVSTWWMNHFKDVKFEARELYHILSGDPRYKVEGIRELKWQHAIYELIK